MFSKKKGTSVSDEIQNAGPFEPDSEESIGCRQHQRDKDFCLRNSQNGNYQAYANNCNVLKFPEPHRGLGSKVVRVNIQFGSPPKVMEAADISAASGSYVFTRPRRPVPSQ